MRSAARALVLLCAAALSACTTGARTQPPDDGSARGDASAPDGGAAPRSCRDADRFCRGPIHVACLADGREEVADCGAILRCAPEGCVACVGEQRGCDGERPARCDGRGAWTDQADDCTEEGLACEAGQCVDPCAAVAGRPSFEGCELYALDLDTAHDEPTVDLSALPFSVVVANPGRHRASVVVEDAEGEVLRFSLAPGELRSEVLPQRELDGRADGGEPRHTAVSDGAYRIRATTPVIAYQMSPAGFVADAYSSDASLLLPREALGADYVVASWPQTLGPSAAVGPARHRRAFVSVAATEPDTDVEIVLGRAAVAVVGLDGERLGPGATVRARLQPFDVLNLETDGRGSDLSGSRVRASHPVAVFTGSEGADVPFRTDPTMRVGAADHLQEQLIPTRAAGRRYLVPSPPSRADAVARARGEPIASIGAEPGFVRVVNTSSEPAVVTTDLPAPDDRVRLAGHGIATLQVVGEALLESDRPVSVMMFHTGQQATGIPRDEPGGDPAAVLIPPTEQFRRSTVFLVPDGYAFDYLTVIAPHGAHVFLDARPLETYCAPTRAAGYDVYRCATSSPRVFGSMVDPGVQADGAHRISADAPVGVLVSGFDRFISYAYVGGLDVQELL